MDKHTDIANLKVAIVTENNLATSQYLLTKTFLDFSSPLPSVLLTPCRMSEPVEEQCQGSSARPTHCTDSPSAKPTGTNQAPCNCTVVTYLLALT